MFTGSESQRPRDFSASVNAGFNPSDSKSWAWLDTAELVGRGSLLVNLLIDNRKWFKSCGGDAFEIVLISLKDRMMVVRNGDATVMNENSNAANSLCRICHRELMLWISQNARLWSLSKSVRRLFDVAHSFFFFFFVSSSHTHITHKRTHKKKAEQQ